MFEEVYISGAARTPIGGFSGAFANTPAAALGSASVQATLERSGVPADKVDEVIFGNVLSAGQGQNVARQVTISSGIGESVGATTINKVCGSGLKSVMLASQAIRCGDAATVVAGGTENMTCAPHLLPKARAGYRMGNGDLVDSLIHDGLWDVYNDIHMGVFGDRCAEKQNITREDQDDFAVASYKRALAATESGVFAKEIVPIEVVSQRSITTLDIDEEPQRFNEEKLRALKAAFVKDGSVTAGNASSINDGAASVLVQSKEAAEATGSKPQVRVLGYATYSREPEWFTLAPIGAIQKLLDYLDLAVPDIDLFEINEAFSAVALAAMKSLEIPRDKVIVHGGAVALGHPIGASGSRTLVTLINAMETHDAKIGIDALCIGGGEAVAMAVERVS